MSTWSNTHSSSPCRPKTSWPQLGNRGFQTLHTTISTEPNTLNSSLFSSNRRERFSFYGYKCVSRFWSVKHQLCPTLSKVPPLLLLPSCVPPPSCRSPAASWRRPRWAERSHGCSSSGVPPALCRTPASPSRNLGQRNNSTFYKTSKKKSDILNKHYLSNMQKCNFLYNVSFHSILLSKSSFIIDKIMNMCKYKLFQEFPGITSSFWISH